MIRLLLLAALFYLGYSLLRSFLRVLPGHRGSPPAAKGPRGEEMVQDPHCGIYVDSKEAVRRKVPDGELFFCSKTCAEAYFEKARHGA